VPVGREQGWQDTVTRAARLLGWLVYHTYDSRRSVAGFPDLVMLRGARCIVAELKTETGQVKPDQKRWLEAFHLIPLVEVYVWRPSDWKKVEDVLH
jgi:VRR-NUC domain-containing protein